MLNCSFGMGSLHPEVVNAFLIFHELCLFHNVHTWRILPAKMLFITKANATSTWLVFFCYPEDRTCCNGDTCSLDTDVEHLCLRCVPCKTFSIVVIENELESNSCHHLLYSRLPSCRAFLLHICPQQQPYLPLI